MNGEWNAILADFEAYVCRCVTENINSQKSYVSYVKSLDKTNEGQTYQWLKDAVACDTPIERLSDTFDEYFDKHPEKAPQTQWKTGLKRLGDFICGFTDSSTNLHSIKDFDYIACNLVAQSAIFCSVEVFEKVKSGELGGKENIGRGNEFGAWFHYTFQRAKHFEKRGEYKDEVVRFDDNTQANSAIKTAILKGLDKYGIHGNSRQSFKGFEACHIWPDTCYDARYHTSVANIVLLPREIAGLTDHCDAVEELLKYEAWKRFGFKPAEEEIPQRPKNYSKIKWRQ